MKHNADIMTGHKHLLHLREAEDTTQDEIEQIDEFLNESFAKYIFL